MDHLNQEEKETAEDPDLKFQLQKVHGKKWLNVLVTSLKHSVTVSTFADGEKMCRESASKRDPNA